jgi:molybdopterin-guanine dinucleotide biosynthesis protein A
MRQAYLECEWRPARFAQFGLPVVADDVADYPGPLAGILAGLDWTAANTAADSKLSAAIDVALSTRREGSQ